MQHQAFECVAVYIDYKKLTAGRQTPQTDGQI